jgi:hypothetical protein
MKNKIRFAFLLFVAAGLICSCTQSGNKAPTANDVITEIASLDGIRENIDLKNIDIYNSIEDILSKDGDDTLVSDLRVTALEIRQRTDEMIFFMQDLKIILIKAVEGEDSPAINGSKINIADIKMLNNSRIPTEILIGKNEDGRAYDIKALIMDYKGFLIESVNNDLQITKSIENELNTEDQKEMQSKAPDEVIQWEKYSFQGQSMGSVLITLNRIQNNVKKAESEALTFLQNGINSR